MEVLNYILAGAVVGFVVGLTGVGGGSFMTPLLLWFGFSPAVAIGTDLLYAAMTKASGMWAHQRQGTVNWQVVKRLAMGSLPASIITILTFKYVFNDSSDYEHVLTSTLGIMLILTSVVLLLRAFNPFPPLPKSFEQWVDTHQGTLTIITGVILGVMVTLSSVGAGAFGAAVLLLLYRSMPTVQVVGTDIAHAVPLTAIAGLGHLHLGNVDFWLLGSLLIGSIPAIWVGSYMARHLPERIMQPMLASALLFIGVKYAIS